MTVQIRPDAPSWAARPIWPNLPTINAPVEAKPEPMMMAMTPYLTQPRMSLTYGATPVGADAHTSPTPSALMVPEATNWVAISEMASMNIWFSPLQFRFAVSGPVMVVIRSSRRWEGFV